MKIKVTNRIPGKKAKEAVPPTTIRNSPEEVEKPDENPPETAKPENREMEDDRNRQAEARKVFEAGVRGKLKYQRKR
ncbi:MAG: hypothetical protein NTZ26_13975 [Candidatus Aminicenantes bacterium]|nr:hypothetical protein [Candidatus Aminicenantes bacterium]